MKDGEIDRGHLLAGCCVVLAFITGAFVMTIAFPVPENHSFWDAIKDIVANGVGGFIGAGAAIYAMTKANQATIRASFVVADLEQTNREIEQINRQNDRRRQLRSITDKFGDSVQAFLSVTKAIKDAANYTGDVSAYQKLIKTPFINLPSEIDWHSREWTVDWITPDISSRYSEFRGAYERLKETVEKRIADGANASMDWEKRVLLWDLTEDLYAKTVQLSTSIYKASYAAAIERESRETRARRLTDELRGRTDPA